MKQSGCSERSDATDLRRESRPPTVDGISMARPADACRTVWWYQCSLFHLARRGRPARRPLAGLLWVASWPFWPVLFLARMTYIALPSTHVYLTTDATLSIRVKRRSWHLGEHIARSLGSGSGRRLRQELLPVLLAYVDSRGIPIEATAATRDLALLYVSELPGLRITGRSWTGGWKVQRPAPPR